MDKRKPELMLHVRPKNIVEGDLSMNFASSKIKKN